MTWLIARREITTRLRSKVFRIATLISILILVGIAVGSRLAGSGPSAQEVGLTPAAAPLATSIASTAATLDVGITLHEVDEATGRDQVRDGKLDALVTGDHRVVVKTDLDDGLRSVLQLSEAGVKPAAVTVTRLAPPRNATGEQLAIGILTSVLIYLSLLLNGQAVAQGVVEEKTSRVVEILLATVRPTQLMIGKVMGLGTVGIIQVGVIAFGGVAAAEATGAVHLHASNATGALVWLIVWFLLGYAAYSFAFAAVASLVSRQEEVAAATTPVLMLLIIGYVIGISILPSNPDSAFVAVLSLIPIFAPTLMPVRLALGVVPAWQSAVALAGMIVVIPLLLWLSARVYRNAVLRTGARVRLREAWRAA